MMFRIFSLVLLSSLIGLFFTSTVWAEEKMLFSVYSQSEFEIGQHPFIYGKAMDSNGNPLPNVEIQANFPSRMIMATTDSEGEFSITSNIPVELGEHTITVYATKGKMYLSTNVTYNTIDRQQIAVSETSQKNTNIETNISKTNNYDNSKYDLFSRMVLEQIEKQKTENTKKKTLSEEQQLILDQRLQTKATLENDLKSFEKQNEFYKPRNAFLRFLADIDHSVKEIFWNQFLFTEKKTQEAHEAKEIALKEGKSSLEAMKIFQQEAAVTQSEIMEYNKDLNVKYVNTTSNIQE